jgi:hypothetical protein
MGINNRDQRKEMREVALEIAVSMEADAWRVRNLARVNSVIMESQDSELRRFRLSQLRRMADGCNDARRRAVEDSERRSPVFPTAQRVLAINARLKRFHTACHAEIQRLKDAR